MNRKDFIKLSSKSALAVFLTSCNIGVTKEEENKENNNSVRETPASLIVKEDPNVIYISKEDERYQTLRQGYNKRISKHPQIIALCKNTEGVSEAIKYACSNNLKIAVKSGGHSFEGFSVNDNGLVIDLSLMKNMDWKTDEIVCIDAGCTLTEVYDYLLLKQRLIPAGSCGSVGLAGLTLGGGYGFFSRKYGLTCDSLKELTLVDGKGTIHKATGADKLLWACKGAGNGNFGIVTNLVFETFKAPATFQSHRLKAYKLTAERAKIILQKWFELAEKLPPSCFSAFVLNKSTLTILITDFEQHQKQLEALLSDLNSLCDKITIGKPLRLAKALKVFYGVQHPIYFKNASAGLYKNFTDIEPYIESVLNKVIQSPGLIYQVNTLGGAIQDSGKEATSAYAHRALPFLSELQAYWQKTGSEEKLLAAFRDIQSIFHENKIDAQYVNYPDIHFENWQKLYYGKNYPQLQEIKSLYDPLNQIQHPQSITVT